MMDKLVVHNIITRNISETPHTYNYIKPRIRKNDRCVKMESLQTRYHNPAMQDMYINEVKQTWENISYKSERAMKFEILSGKFHNAVNILETYGRQIHNEDIVEMIWLKLQSTELSMFVSSLKIDYRQIIQNYSNIFQEIATQIPTAKSQPFSPTEVYELNRIEGHSGNRFGIYFPASGAHMEEGTLYNGSYPYTQWISK